MATKYWLGTADAVAQVDTVQITGFDATTTYKLTINNRVVSFVGSVDADTTATGLKDAWNASTNPYFEQVTATVSTDTITLTADNAGAPFITTSSVSGGAGTIGAVTNQTVSAGPNDWSTAENWSDFTLPVNADTVHIEDTDISIAFGLDQSAVTLTFLRIAKTFTGRIGLDYRKFATSADGVTVDATEDEYREFYLKISATDVCLGPAFGSGNPAGSARIMINTGPTASNIEIIDTASASSETGRHAVRLLANNASTDIFVRSAPGGVGIASEVAGEVTVIGKISISEVSSASRVEVGIGVSITTFEQNGGDNILQATTTVTKVEVNGGTLQTEFDFTITTLELNDGTVIANAFRTGGDAITTLNLNGGTIDATNSNIARTWNTVNLAIGGTIIADSDILTITTLNEPSKAYTLTISS